MIATLKPVVEALTALRLPSPSSSSADSVWHSFEEPFFPVEWWRSVAWSASAIYELVPLKGLLFVLAVWYAFFRKPANDAGGTSRPRGGPPSRPPPEDTSNFSVCWIPAIAPGDMTSAAKDGSIMLLLIWPASLFERFATASNTELVRDWSAALHGENSLRPGAPLLRDPRFVVRCAVDHKLLQPVFTHIREQLTSDPRWKNAALIKVAIRPKRGRSALCPLNCNDLQSWVQDFADGTSTMPDS